MKHTLLVLIIIILFATLISGCKQDPNNPKQVTTNENIILTKDFYINSESTDLKTSVQGTVFLYGEDGVPDHAKIVAFVEIDPNDWGGIGISLSDQWNILSITSSYPEGKEDKTPEDYASVWYTAEETRHGWKKRIEIGRDTHRWTSTGGGKGTVVIELEINEENKDPLDAYRMSVGVGSEEKDGIRSIHPDYEIIKIAIP
jgi:hypothetical protein